MGLNEFGLWILVAFDGLGQTNEWTHKVIGLRSTILVVLF